MAPFLRVKTKRYSSKKMSLDLLLIEVERFHSLEKKCSLSFEGDINGSIWPSGSQLYDWNMNILTEQIFTLFSSKCFLRRICFVIAYFR